MKKLFLFFAFLFCSITLWSNWGFINPSGALLGEKLPSEFIDSLSFSPVKYKLFYVRKPPIRINKFDSLIVKKSCKYNHKIWRTINNKRVFQRVSYTVDISFRVDTLLIFNQRCKDKNGGIYISKEYYIVGLQETYKHTYYKQSDDSKITNPYDVPLSSNLNNRHHFLGKKEISSKFFEFLNKFDHKWVVVEKTSDNIKEPPSLFDGLFPYI